MIITHPFSSPIAIRLQKHWFYWRNNINHLKLSYKICIANRWQQHWMHIRQYPTPKGKKPKFMLIHKLISVWCLFSADIRRPKQNNKKPLINSTKTVFQRVRIDDVPIIQVHILFSLKIFDHKHNNEFLKPFSRVNLRFDNIYQLVSPLQV